MADELKNAGIYEPIDRNGEETASLSSSQVGSIAESECTKGIIDKIHKGFIVHAARVIQPKLSPTDAIVAIGGAAEMAFISENGNQKYTPIGIENKATGSVYSSVIALFLDLTTTLGIYLANGTLLSTVACGIGTGMMNDVLNWGTSDEFHRSQGFNI